MSTVIPSRDELATDAKLAVRLCNKEPSAMEDVYDCHGSFSYSLVLRLVGDHQVAEDLVQETFLRVWTRIHLYAPDRGAMRAWIAAIARNLAMDHLRSCNTRRQTWNFEPSRLEQLPSHALQPERELFFRVDAAFDKLTADQKRVLDLAYFQGLSQTEIAGLLRRPLGTVKTWVRVALSTLRAEILSVRSKRSASKNSASGQGAPW